MGGCLSLDNILSAAAFFVRKWSPDLARNQSRDLLRFVICRLYDQSRGKLLPARLELAQGTLARKLGLSRQWVGILLARLQEAGWIEYAAPWVGPGMRGSTIICIGRQLKRLLIMLAKSRRGKKRVKLDDKEKWQFSPPIESKNNFLIQKKEQELFRPEILQKIPLLKRWMERGSTIRESKEESLNRLFTNYIGIADEENNDEN